MKIATILVSGAALSLASAAMANIPASYTGAGGVIPASGTGGGGTWQSVLPPSPFTSSVTVLNDVKSVKSITFTDLRHTWIGDVHIVLTTPNARYNVFVRGGSVAGSVGWSDNFLGNYTFADGGVAVPGGVGSANNIASGTYAWGFNSAQWTNGNLGIFNSSAAGISGSAGTWSIQIYDWVGADSGSLLSWTLNVNEVPAPGAAALFGLAGLAGLRRRR